jgi:endonuclease III
MKSTKKSSKLQSSKIIEVLDAMFPNAHVELNYHNHFELLIAVVLSAQTTDISVNKVTDQLFKRYPTPEKLATANLSDVEAIIKTIGLYKNKTKNIINLSKDLVDLHNSTVPNNREDLEKLPGVGRKTANVVLSNAFNIPAFAVDTHVLRVSKRLGIAKEIDNERQTEEKLMKKFDQASWTKLHHQLIFFGRYHCLARNPKCANCMLYDICTYKEKSK